jgi:hypothetical protein
MTTGSELTASRVILDPGNKHVLRAKFDKLQRLRDAQKEITSIYFYDHIDYTDIYQRRWKREFCYVWEPWLPVDDRFVTYKEHNEENQIL